jgi:peptidoglycan/xylan/chitin deacetylase (PgdA/CDA1 family)
MTKAHPKYNANGRTSMSSVSLFVLLCGVMAIFYLIYRIVLVVLPATALGQSFIDSQGPHSIVCQQEEGVELQDPVPILSMNYQKRLNEQKALTPNLIPNASLSEMDPVAGEPTGYVHAVDNDTSKYQYMQDLVDDTYFLRVTNKRKTPSGEISPTWLAYPASVEQGRTYRYGFEYRSDTPVQVTVEYDKGPGSLEYKDMVVLEPTVSWQKFTAHFENMDKVLSFRVVANSKDVGYVDTRSFTAEQIPDAKLSKGRVSVTFDDGWQSIDNKAGDLLKRYNIRSTQYVITEVANQNVAGYMGFDTLRKLKQEGHEIGSHSLTHCNQTKLDAAALKDNAVHSKQLLEQEHLGPIKSFAYPLGQYSAATQAVFTGEYPYVRASDAGYNDRYFDETNIRSMGVLDTTSDKEFQSWLEYAKAHQLWLVIVYHRIDESGKYSVTSGQLDRQLQMITRSGMDIMPLGEAADTARK